MLQKTENLDGYLIEVLKAMIETKRMVFVQLGLVNKFFCVEFPCAFQLNLFSCALNFIVIFKTN